MKRSLLLLLILAVGCKTAAKVAAPTAPPSPALSDKRYVQLLQEISDDLTQAPTVPGEMYLAVLRDMEKLHNEPVESPTFMEDAQNLIDDLHSMRWAVEQEHNWSTI